MSERVRRDHGDDFLARRGRESEKLCQKIKFNYIKISLNRKHVRLCLARSQFTVVMSEHSISDRRVMAKKVLVLRRCRRQDEKKRK